MHFQRTDYYELLGVSPAATQETIQVSYEKNRRKYENELQDSYLKKDILSDLQEAYSVLANPGMRREYDSWLNGINQERYFQSNSSSTRLKSSNLVWDNQTSYTTNSTKTEERRYSDMSTEYSRREKYADRAGFDPFLDQIQNSDVKKYYQSYLNALAANDMVYIFLCGRNLLETILSQYARIYDFEYPAAEDGNSPSSKDKIDYLYSIGVLNEDEKDLYHKARSIANNLHPDKLAANKYIEKDFQNFKEYIPLMLQTYTSKEANPGTVYIDSYRPEPSYSSSRYSAPHKASRKGSSFFSTLLKFAVVAVIAVLAVSLYPTFMNTATKITSGFTSSGTEAEATSTVTVTETAAVSESSSAPEWAETSIKKFKGLDSSFKFLKTYNISVGQDHTNQAAAVWPIGAAYSSDPSVVTVDENGIATGVSSGSAYVVVRSTTGSVDCFQYNVN